MIDKIKELENLENKYKEIGKLNSEIESIIAIIKNLRILRWLYND